MNSTPYTAACSTDAKCDRGAAGSTGWNRFGGVDRWSIRFVRLMLLALVVVGAIGWLAVPVSAQTELIDGQSVRGRVAAQNGFFTTRTWAYYYVDVEDWHGEYQIDLTVLRGNPDLYIRYGQLPTRRHYDQASATDNPTESITLGEGTNPQLKSGRYYIGVITTRGVAQFDLVGQRRSLASSRLGIGAKPYPEGTMFRVWAPFADEVHVTGEFNDWNSWVAPLQSEGNGIWSLDYRNAQPGQRYMYVIRNGGQTYWRMDPREEQVTNSIGETVIFDESFNWTDGGFQAPNWNEMVIYQMHIGTFNDAPGFGPGHFDSAIAKLDHVKDLGVNAVLLMPITEFPGDFSWGYNPSQPNAVETAYGGPAAFKRFIDAAHARGIAVIMDVVYNHWGPTDLDMWQFDGWSENGRGGIYFYQDDRANTQWGDTRPDYGRGEVRQYIRDNALMWLQDFHVDGLRWDSVLNVRTTNSGDNPEGWSLMQWVNNEIDAVQPWAISIAEDMQDNEWITRDTGGGGAGFDSQWTAQFVHPVREVIVGMDDNSRDMFKIRDAIYHRYNTDALERVIYTESHDEVANGRSRVPEEIWPGNAGSWFSKKRSTLGGALVMTSPGIPMLFQGQEFLEDGYFHDEDPLDWNKTNTYAGIVLMYRDLIRLRRNWFDTTRGLRGQHVNVFHVNNNDKMVAFHRWDQGGPRDDVIVVLNFRDTTWQDYRIGLPRGGVWKVRFNSDWEGYSDDFGNFYSPDVTADGWGQDGMPFSGSLKIAPYSVLILSQD